MRTRTLRAAAAFLSGCLLAFGLSGCCAPQRCCRGPVVKEEAEPAAASPQPLPGAPEYPRFHPVPTRPVFLPQGLETPPAEMQPVPNQPPLTAVPNDGWRPAGK
ncbi:MAG: hypothetical protein ACLP9L_31740 [Thermoguttaceae bacterium]